MFEDLKDSRFLFTLDLMSGYWQVRRAENCKKATIFVCRYGIYKFEMITFGLMNPPSTFQRTMDVIFVALPLVRV